MVAVGVLGGVPVEDISHDPEQSAAGRVKGHALVRNVEAGRSDAPLEVALGKRAERFQADLL